MTSSAFNRVAVQTGALLKPHRIDLYAANGKPIETFGLAERVRFQVDGYELETNFVGLDVFLLGQNFLRAYQVLVDLTAKKIVVRAPVRHVWHRFHTQVGNPDLVVPIIADQGLVLQLIERTVVRATVVTNNIESLMFQKVELTFPLRTHRCNILSF